MRLARANDGAADGLFVATVWSYDRPMATSAAAIRRAACLPAWLAARSASRGVCDGRWCAGLPFVVSVLAPGSLALGEVLFLLYDELREPRSYLAILEAIGNGHHTFKAIKDATLLGDVHLPAYLSTLQEMRYVERRLPVTIPPAKQRVSRQGRYHLSDPFMRFYFRFIHPHRDVVSYAPERILPTLQSGLRAFVGQTAWEDLARQWVREQGYQGALPFVPEVVGSHWSRTVQADVVAINWTERAILVGECKWGDTAVDRQTVRDLIERTVPLTLADLPDKGEGWQVYPALFARAGATPAARKTLMAASGFVVDLPVLFADLAE
jgi:hypothetical protein